jgi:hypothetical protein
VAWFLIYKIEKSCILVLKKQTNVFTENKKYTQIFFIKRDEAIYTCILNDIPLTDENIKEVIEILIQKERIKLLENSRKLNYKKQKIRWKPHKIKFDTVNPIPRNSKIKVSIPSIIISSITVLSFY